MKLRVMLNYERATLLKAISIFYAVFLMILFAINLLNRLFIGTDAIGVFSGLEVASIIFIGQCSASLVSDDFKLFIQNGFTRKHISKLVVLTLLALAMLMALVDTFVGAMFSDGFYRSIFTQFYGNEFQIVAQWCWGMSVYFSISIFVGVICLLYHRFGKQMFFTLLIAFSILCVVLVPMLVAYVIPESITNQAMMLFLAMMGYVADGTIHIINPILSFSFLGLAGSLITFVFINKLEVK